MSSLLLPRRPTAAQIGARLCGTRGAANQRAEEAAPDAPPRHAAVRDEDGVQPQGKAQAIAAGLRRPAEALSCPVHHCRCSLSVTRRRRCSRPSRAREQSSPRSTPSSGTMTRSRRPPSATTSSPSAATRCPTRTSSGTRSRPRRPPRRQRGRALSAGLRPAARPGPQPAAPPLPLVETSWTRLPAASAACGRAGGRCPTHRRRADGLGATW